MRLVVHIIGKQFVKMFLLITSESPASIVTAYANTQKKVIQ